MSQETASVETKLPKAVGIDWQRGGLRWKISATFSGLILVLGLFVIGIVYYFTNAALQKQFGAGRAGGQVRPSGRCRLRLRPGHQRRSARQQPPAFSDRIEGCRRRI